MEIMTVVNLYLGSRQRQGQDRTRLILARQPASHAQLWLARSDGDAYGNNGICMSRAGGLKKRNESWCGLEAALDIITSQ